jgi:hypothetical protein
MQDVFVYLVITLFLFTLLYPLTEPFYNPEEPLARPDTFPDHSGNRHFMEIEKILYSLIQTPSMNIEEKAFLEDFLNLIQSIPETKPPEGIKYPKEGNSTVQELQYVKQLLLQEFAAITVENAAYIPLKNSIYYITWLLKNIFV